MYERICDQFIYPLFSEVQVKGREWPSLVRGKDSDLVPRCYQGTTFNIKSGGKIEWVGGGAAIPNTWQQEVVNFDGLKVDSNTGRRKKRVD